MPILSTYIVPHPPLIVPEVGRGGEKQIEKTRASYARVAEEIMLLDPETVVITSPHAVLYRDWFHISPGKSAKGSFAPFRAPSVRFEVRYDTELVREIERLAGAEAFPAGTDGEREPSLDHGTMVPLYFIREAYADKPMPMIVRIGLSGFPLEDHYRLGQLIREAVEITGRRTVFAASGDLSHKLQKDGPYGFAPEGPAYDIRLMDICSRAAFGELFDFGESFCEKAAECGHRSFVIMAGSLDGQKVEAEVYSHEDVTGVGYGICAFHPGSADENRRFLELRRSAEQSRLAGQREACDPWVRLAWQSVESYVTKRRVLPLPEGLPDALLHTRAGAFVSIHEHGQLRGCIGTIAPVRDSLAEEIIHNAVSACARDPRFDPIRPDELPFLEISVDVIGAHEEIQSADELDVKRYGVIVSKGTRRGLLLPDLDGVDTVEQQISIARQKAGIGEGETIRLERFEVVRHT
ncbi:MAG: AmmeMemoRadiSam system protein A [Ruminococcaceae bacterium]|nr:AmmeMemoRadiSam system protein A [Oscillospiraceae bacterium]